VSDLDRYTQLLKEQSVKRMDLAGSLDESANAIEAARKQERTRIAIHLLFHYKAGALSL